LIKKGQNKRKQIDALTPSAAVPATGTIGPRDTALPMPWMGLGL
jgi:hypothetical protein